MAKKIQTYSSVLAFSRHHDICLPKPHDWRLIAEPVTGEINGISGIRGFAVATNGIHVALEAESGDLAFGHLDWFIPDKAEPGVESTSESKPRSSRQSKVLAEYL